MHLVGSISIIFMWLVKRGWMTVIRRICNRGKPIGDKRFGAKRFYDVNRLTYFLSPGKTI